MAFLAQQTFVLADQGGGGRRHARRGFDVVLESFDTLGAAAVQAMSKQGWSYINERWMLVGVKL